MMEVTTVDGGKFKIEDAKTWHVDDTGGLHLRKDGKTPVASFAATKWVAVQSLNA